MTAKLFPLPHLNAVLAGLGCSAFFLTLHAIMINTGAGFDEIVGGMPEMVPHCTDHVRAQAGREGVADVEALLLQEIVLVGWSRRADRLVGWQWTVDPPKLQARAIAPYYISPWHESLEAIPDPTTAERMAELVRGQIALLRRVEPGLGAGGKIHVAQLAKDRLRIDSFSGLDRSA